MESSEASEEPSSGTANPEQNLADENTPLNELRTMGSNWKQPIETFTSAVQDVEKGSNHSKKIRKFYEKQNDLIKNYEDLHNCEVNTPGDTVEEPTSSDTRARIQRKAEIAAKVSFGANLLLFVVKMISVVLSGSLSILSSVIDSAVDLLSGIVLWATSYNMRKNDYYKYPGGKRRMEPLAILILSVIMSSASGMVIIRSAETIQDYIVTDEGGPDVDLVTIIIIVCTILIKFVLFLVIRKIPSPSAGALAQDHRNDVLSNIVALVMGFVGSDYWRFADPIGAIVIAVYIIISWCITAYEQVMVLTGRAAGPEFLKKLTWIAINHDHNMKQIDTVTAFHFGNQFLVEVHIVLPEKMYVKKAHDIQESLQQRLEILEEVERAFVHIDYEAKHDPTSEHKLL